MQIWSHGEDVHSLMSSKDRTYLCVNGNVLKIELQNYLIQTFNGLKINIQLRRKQEFITVVLSNSV